MTTSKKNRSSKEPPVVPQLWGVWGRKDCPFSPRRHGGHGDFTEKPRDLLTAKLKILALLEGILLGEILGALGVFAVNGVTQFSPRRRQGCKENAKEIWLRLGCSVNPRALRVSVVKLSAP